MKYEDGGWKMEDGGRRRSTLRALRRLCLFHLPSSILYPLFASGCSAPDPNSPLPDPPQLNDPKLVAGQQVFVHHCYQCHPGGNAGLGPALNNKPLPAFAIKTQVRKGFGAMPAFDPQTIPDPDLDNLVAYLKALRQRAGE